MIKSRILWGMWLIFSICFWLFTKDYIGVMILIFSLIIPVFMVIGTWYAAKKIIVSFQAETFGDKGAIIKAGLVFKNNSIFPLDRVICNVNFENVLTGEKYVPKVRVSLPGKSKIFQELEFSSKYCGNVRLCLKKSVAYDLFGLFPFSISCNGEEQTFVRPETFGMEISIAYGENMSLDSDEFSMVKSGFDPSETFAIREYKIGDRIKQVHWKLSEKLDELMVRDYGLPIQNTILLLFETGSIDKNQVIPECMDALAEGILSLAQELVEQQIVFSIGWQNHETNIFSSIEVNNIEDMVEVISGVLNAVPGEDETSVLGHYLEEREYCEFAHVVLFSSHQISDAETITEQSLVTEIICKKEEDGTYEDGGVHILCTTPERIQYDLSYLEI